MNIGNPRKLVVYGILERRMHMSKKQLKEFCEELKHMTKLLAIKYDVEVVPEPTVKYGYDHCVLNLLVLNKYY